MDQDVRSEITHLETDTCKKVILNLALEYRQKIIQDVEKGIRKY